KLVEQQHQRQQPVRAAGPVVQRAGGGVIHQRTEALRDGGVTLGNDLGRVVAAEPQMQALGKVRRDKGITGAEPEVEDFLGPGQRPTRRAHTHRQGGARSELAGGASWCALTGVGSLAEALEHALCYRRQALPGQFAGTGGIHDVFQRSRDHHAAYRRMLGRQPRHLVEHGEAAIDLVARRGSFFNGTGQVLAKATEQKIVVVTDLESRFGEKVGKILLEILSDTQQAGTGVRVGRRFVSLHRSSSSTSKGPDNHFWASRAVPHPATRANNKTNCPATQWQVGKFFPTLTKTSRKRLSSAARRA